jgi:hypothetical protein
MADHDEKITMPVNKVLAVLGDRKQADEAVMALIGAGIPGDSVRLLREEEANENIAGRMGDKTGVLGHIFKMIEEIHTDSNAMLEQYREAGREGKEVLSVDAHSPEEVETIQGVLQKLYAENVRYFGVFSIRDLSTTQPKKGGQG